MFRMCLPVPMVNYSVDSSSDAAGSTYESRMLDVMALSSELNDQKGSMVNKTLLSPRRKCTNFTEIPSLAPLCQKVFKKLSGNIISFSGGVWWSCTSGLTRVKHNKKLCFLCGTKQTGITDLNRIARLTSFWIPPKIIGDWDVPQFTHCIYKSWKKFPSLWWVDYGSLLPIISRAPSSVGCDPIWTLKNRPIRLQSLSILKK